jgi:hypothetical protein
VQLLWGQQLRGWVEVAAAMGAACMLAVVVTAMHGALCVRCLEAG